MSTNTAITDSLDPGQLRKMSRYNRPQKGKVEKSKKDRREKVRNTSKDLLFIAIGSKCSSSSTANRGKFQKTFRNGRKSR